MAQLRLAVELLAMPSPGARERIEAWRAEHPGALVELRPDEDAPLLAEDEDDPFCFLDTPPLPMRDADVWIFGNPPDARANRFVMPRLKVAAPHADARDAKWLLRTLKDRAKTYERVVQAALRLQPALALALDQSELTDVRTPSIAADLGMHESTIERVLGAVRIQNLHHVWAFTRDKNGFRLVGPLHDA